MHAQPPARQAAQQRMLAFEFPSSRPISKRDLNEFIYRLVIDSKRISKNEAREAVVRNARRLVIEAIDALIREGKVRKHCGGELSLSEFEASTRRAVANADEVNPFYSIVTLASMKEAVLQILSAGEADGGRLAEMIVAKLSFMFSDALSDLLKSGLRETSSGLLEPAFTRPMFKLRAEPRQDFTKNDVQRFLLKLLLFGPVRMKEIEQRFTENVPLAKRAQVMEQVDIVLQELVDARLAGFVDDANGREYVASAALEENALKVHDAVKRYLISNHGAPIRADFVETRVASIISGLPEVPDEQKTLLTFVALAQLEQLGLVSHSMHVLGFRQDGQKNLISKWSARPELLRQQPFAEPPAK